MRLIILLLFISIVSVNAQDGRTRESYFTLGANVGLIGFSVSKTDAANGNALTRCTGFGFTDNGRGTQVPAANTSLGINAGYLWKDKKGKNFTSFGLELQRNRATYVFTNLYSISTGVLNAYDNDEDDHYGTTINWTENDVYYKYSISLQRLWYLSDKSKLGGNRYFYTKESFGQSFLHYNQGNLVNLKDQENVSFYNGYNVIVQTMKYHPFDFVLGSEIGFRSLSKNKSHALDIGIVWYQPFTSTYTRQYDFYCNSNLSGQNRITFTGTSVLLNLSLYFNSLRKQKQILQVKETFQ